MRIESVGIAARPVEGDAAARGTPQRLRELVREALERCGGAPPAPLVVASCNGMPAGPSAEAWAGAFDTRQWLGGTAWGERALPVVSTSCTSGLHAAMLALRLGAPDVVVLAVDVASAVSREHFAALRVLAPEREPPWQAASAGFVPGEAAVAVRLCRDGCGPQLLGPVGGVDLADVLAPLSSPDPELVLGQGTGPNAVDAAELEAIRDRVSGGVPLATTLWEYGHTLGASSLLAVATAAARTPLPMPAQRATDGRPLSDGAVSRDTLVACRALAGGCVAARVVHDARAPDALALLARYDSPAPAPPITTEWLRDLAGQAPAHRPVQPPDLLIVRLDAPLVPPSRAAVGGRLLPTAILEITPGFVAHLVARRWGYRGAALTVVVTEAAAAETERMARCTARAGERIEWIHIRGQGQRRRASWS